MITVIIASKHRLLALDDCLKSLAKIKRCSFEVIVVQQDNGSVPIARGAYKALPALISLYMPRGGKSCALNSAISKSRGDIIALTDDDCIVSDLWMNEIEQTFKHHPEISGITGNTYPYKNIPPWSCPSTIVTKRAVFSAPLYHAAVGFGNNFAIRKSVLLSIGLFKTWLGPGSVGSSCEDGEIILRILMKGYTILHNPEMVIYHNKKLNTSAVRKQNLSYLCGEMACYMYYSLSGYDFAKTVVNNNILSSIHDMKRICGDIIKRRMIRPKSWGCEGTKFITRLRGCIIGTMYYIKEVLFRV